MPKTLIPDSERAAAARKSRNDLCSMNLQFGLPVSWSSVTGQVTYSTTGTATTLLCQHGHIVAGNNSRMRIKPNGSPDIRCRACNQASKVLETRAGDHQTEADVRYYAMIGELPDTSADVENLREQRDMARERVVAIAGHLVWDRARRARIAYREAIANPPETSLAVRNPDAAARVVVFHPALVSNHSNFEVPFMCANGEHPHVAETTRPGKRAIPGRANNCGICTNASLVVGVNDMATLYPELAARVLVVDPQKVIGFGSKSVKKIPIICDDHPTVAPVMRARAWENRRTETFFPCGICANQALGIGVNNLATVLPELADRILVFDPKIAFAGNGQQIPVMCTEHGYTANVRTVQTLNRGDTTCDGCNGHVAIRGVNTLDVTHPEIAETVIIYDPAKITRAHKMPVPKLCEVETYPHHGIAYASRRAIEGCPCCNGTSFVVPHINSTAVVFPELAQFRDSEADYTQERASSTRGLALSCPDCGSEVPWNPSSRANRRWLREGRLCPTCDERSGGGGFDGESESGIFYFDSDARATERPRMRLLHWGITNRSVEERMSEHRWTGIIPGPHIEALETRPGRLAQLIEATINRSVRDMVKRLDLRFTRQHSDGEREHKRREVMRARDAVDADGAIMNMLDFIEAAHDQRTVAELATDGKHWSKISLPADYLPEIVTVASIDEVPEDAPVVRARYPLPRVIQ